jgi:Adenine-specific methyltransferase EcoRI
VSAIPASRNSNLHKANRAKNDEFYTQLPDIEKELKHYKDHFKGKVVFCNCDDPEWSNFWKYFALNFDHLGLKKLISTHFEREKPSYKLELERKDGKLEPIRTNLTQNGDFRSPECIELLKEADIVVTNPPFSLFREYIAQLVEYDKKFIVIGSQNAITYKEIFKLIKNNQLWLGCTLPKEFVKPDGSIQKFGNISWFTSLLHKKRNEEIILYKPYDGNEGDYPKYDNYDAIEVSKTKEIPVGYDGVMGVPITFLDRYNPTQFEIVGNEYDLNIEKGRCYVMGKRMYSRIFIKNNKKSVL